MVPFYLLEREASQYPVYVDNSNIDESLASDFKIDCISVGLSESVQEAISELYRGNFSEMQRRMNNSGNHSYRSASPALGSISQNNFGSASNILSRQDGGNGNGGPAAHVDSEQQNKLLNNLAVPERNSNLLGIAAA